MNITELLIPQSMIDQQDLFQQQQQQKQPTKQDVSMKTTTTPIHDDDLMTLWERTCLKAGFNSKSSSERNTLTDTLLTPIQNTTTTTTTDIPVHIKVIGRHMNGSFRCHIGTSKASRPIRSTELCCQMRLLVVFFRSSSSSTTTSDTKFVSPEFIFFPTWLLHLFRYTQYGTTPGRTDVRFLENANMAKEDHIYRLNHVLNTLFRFNIHHVDIIKLKQAIQLANYLFDEAGLDYKNLPKPFDKEQQQPKMYSTLLLLLHAPRPTKFKPMCFNCNTKSASRRKLCVACYRYQLKHGESRPLRLIVANRPGPRTGPSPTMENVSVGVGTFSSIPNNNNKQTTKTNNIQQQQQQQKKSCANCKIQETHQWYRNLCGHGHWCETCKSYYLRHTKVRPPELFVKAAKRKVDVRNLVNWSTWSWDDIPIETVEAATQAISQMNFSSSSVVSPINKTTSHGYYSNNQAAAALPHHHLMDYYFGNDNNMMMMATVAATSPMSSSASSSGNSSITSSPTTPPLPSVPSSHVGGYYNKEEVTHEEKKRRCSYYSTSSSNNTTW